MSHRKVKQPAAMIVLLYFSLTAYSQANAAQSFGSAIVPFNPDSVKIPDDLPTPDNYRTVVASFVTRGWRITEINRSSHYVDAEYPIREHVGRVRANIAAGNVTFSYRESENLDHGWIHKVNVGPTVEPRLFKKPQEQSDPEAVHRNYLSWVNEVARTLKGKFLLETMK